MRKAKYLLIMLSVILYSISMISCKNSDKSDEVLTHDAYYAEQHRPLIHFTPDSMWMNDPNGMVYHDGEYHLYYQYYPDSTVWGPMHWGHAVSKDMVHWEHLPIALYPDSLGYIFSGSAVVDKGNTSGLGIGGKDPIIAVFTHHNMDGEKAGQSDFQYQSIAFSNDNGRTFTKYKHNPVIKNPGIKDFRDPKVIWYEKGKYWVMVVAAYDKAIFYTSPNLLNWTKTGEFGIPGDDRLWECPDLFPIKAEGSGEEKWVLITSIQKKAPNGGTATSYFTGDFDGKSFKGDNKNQKWLDYGKDNYAMVTWSNAPDGRILALGWMSNWQYAQNVPTKRWRSAMTLPRELKLYKTGQDFDLFSMPVKELKSLEKDSIFLTHNSLVPQKKTFDIRIPAKLEFSFKKPATGIINLRFLNKKGEYLDIGYDADSNTYALDRLYAGISDFSQDFAGIHTVAAGYGHDTIKILIYVDRSSIELFADGGRCVMTDIFFPSEPYSALEISGDDVYLISGKITDLNSILR